MLMLGGKQTKHEKTFSDMPRFNMGCVVWL